MHRNLLSRYLVCPWISQRIGGLTLSKVCQFCDRWFYLCKYLYKAERQICNLITSTIDICSLIRAARIKFLSFHHRTMQRKISLFSLFQAKQYKMSENLQTVCENKYHHFISQHQLQMPYNLGSSPICSWFCQCLP